MPSHICSSFYLLLSFGIKSLSWELCSLYFVYLIKLKLDLKPDGFGDGAKLILE